MMEKKLIQLMNLIGLYKTQKGNHKGLPLHDITVRRGNPLWLPYFKIPENFRFST